MTAEEIAEEVAKAFAANNGEPNAWEDYVPLVIDWLTAIGDAGYEVVEQS